MPSPCTPRRIDTDTPDGQVTVSLTRSTPNRSLANRPAGADGGWIGSPSRCLRHRDAVGTHRSIGRVAVNRRVVAALVAEEIDDEILSDRRVAGVAGRDDRVRDDLAVGVDGYVTLVAIEATGLGLVPVPGVGIDSRDHSIAGDLAGDAEPAVVTLLEILAATQRSARSPRAPPAMSTRCPTSCVLERSERWPGSRG